MQRSLTLGGNTGRRAASFLVTLVDEAEGGEMRFLESWLE